MAGLIFFWLNGGGGAPAAISYGITSGSAANKAGISCYTGIVHMKANSIGQENIQDIPMDQP